MLALVLTVSGLPLCAESWQTELVSRGFPGDVGNAASTATALSSADGRYVVFSGQSTNLVVGQVDTNSAIDVFLFDRVTQATSLVSGALGSATTTANNESYPTAISADGNWVLYSSRATNVVTGVTDGNANWDVFLFDRSSGTSTLVSRASGVATATANSYSTSAAMSADGNWVLYRSNATDVVPGVTDGNGGSLDVFLFDRSSGTSTLVSRALGSATATANNESSPTAISADGNWVLYSSRATNVVTGVTDGNANWDVFLFDRSSGTSTLVSRALGSATATANNASYPTAISADGNWVLYYSSATNVVAGVTDGNGTLDVFLFDRSSGTSTLVSRALGSATATANNASYPTAISADGNWVLYYSQATNVVAGVTDGNGTTQDVFLFDRSSGTSTLVSRALGSATATANNASYPTAISADGRWVLYSSQATNVVAGVTDGNGTSDVFLFDRSSGTSTLVSRALGSATATANNYSLPTAISVDGNWVLYYSQATNVVAGVTDGNVTNPDVFLFELGSGTSTLVSRAQGSAKATAYGGHSIPTAISADGNWVLYRSYATNAVPGMTDGNANWDIFLFDRSSGTSTLVSRALGSATATANNESSPTAISADGNWVLYSSRATNVVTGVTDGNANWDVFLFDRSSGTSTLVSRALGSATATANNASYPTAISADGNWVLYYSSATNVVAGVTDGNGTLDVFLFDRSSGTSTLVSRALGSATATANNASYPTAISADGNWVLYYSQATNVVAGVTDGNGTTQDVFLFDRSSGTSTLVSRALGSATATANNASGATAISADGNWVLYRSNATDVVPGVTDGNGGSLDVFLFDRSSGTSTLVSRALGSATATANNYSQPTAISADGNWVLYQSDATNVVAGVTDGNGMTRDVFLFDRSSGTSTLVSRALGSATATANNASYPTAISADGNWVLYYSQATNVVVGVTDGNGTTQDVFLFDRSSGTSTLVSRALGSATATANSHSLSTAISADGATVLFESAATNIWSDVLDVNSTTDVFVSQHRFTVTPVADGGGSIDPAAAFDVNANATASLVITPDAGYAVQSVTGCGGTWTGSNPYTTAPITADCTVTANFVINQYTLTYTAGANGSISGSAVQTVNHGANGSAVTAVPDLGYHFVQWTDNSTANPRTDSNVTANISVTATFANEAPSIAAVGDQTVLEDSSTAQITFQVADLESAAASLLVTAASSETGLIPNPSVGAGASDGERVLTYSPMAHQNGSTAITLTINDPAGGSAQRSFIINVTAVNDAPQLSLGSVTAHPAATSGMQSVPGFATVVLGPAEEPTTQAIDDFVVQTTDPDGVLSALDIGNDGALSYTLTGVGGTASISARVRDTGGTSNGGVDLSSTRNFSIEVARGADLQVAKTNARQHLLVGEQVVYAIVVANAGPNAVNGATIDDPLPTTLSGGNWMCVQALSTATCPSPDAGGGNLNATIDLSVNQYLRFDVLATVNAAVNETVSNTATVAVPNGVAALNTGNDSSTDADPVVPEVVHRDGFESDPGSNLTVPGAEEALRL